MTDLPKLYARNKKGAWKEWSVSVETTGERPVVVVLHGQHGGQLVEERTIVEEVKRGCADLQAQALRVAQSKWNHKRNRGSYRETMVEEQAENIPMPMLAQTYGKKVMAFPVFAQPKIDGLRCMARMVNGDVELYSRTGAVFHSVDHIRSALHNFLKKNPDLVLDGELYSSDIPFEELSGLCRRGKDQAVGVAYHVFDVVLNEKQFQERMACWKDIRATCVHPVETIMLKSADEIEDYMDVCLSKGYEGVVLRDPCGLYEVGHRSWSLQKHKRFHEEEFEITGFAEGVGREKGAVIWECVTKTGKTFRVRPTGDHDQRRKWLTDAPSYIGKMLTVCFQEYTQQGVPRFPVAKAIREGY